MIKVLFVCMGNICRSPTTHGVFRNMVKEKNLEHKIAVDSAGTHDYHVGEPPDERSCLAAKNKQIDIEDLKARKIAVEDFANFDYILAMDRDNLYELENIAPPEHGQKLGLLLDYARIDWNTNEVPDPYFGGDRGFAKVFAMVHDASEGLLEYIIKNHNIIRIQQFLEMPNS